MENNLSKAIKFPVRYDEEAQWIVDGNDMVVANIGHTELYSLDGFSMDAFGHALAEMINGLDGRGNLQDDGRAEKIKMLRNILKELIPPLESYRDHDMPSINMLISIISDVLDKTGSLEAPDRQVKSAEDVFQSKNGGKDSDTSVEHGETFTAKFVIDFAESYAQQYK